MQQVFDNNIDIKYFAELCQRMTLGATLDINHDIKNMSLIYRGVPATESKPALKWWFAHAIEGPITGLTPKRGTE